MFIVYSINRKTFSMINNKEFSSLNEAIEFAKLTAITSNKNIYISIIHNINNKYIRLYFFGEEYQFFENLEYILYCDDPKKYNDNKKLYVYNGIIDEILEIKSNLISRMKYVKLMNTV